MWEGNVFSISDSPQILPPDVSWSDGGPGPVGGGGPGLVPGPWGPGLVSCLFGGPLVPVW